MNEQAIGIALLALGGVVIFAALRGDRARFTLAGQVDPGRRPIVADPVEQADEEDPDEIEVDTGNSPLGLSSGPSALGLTSTPSGPMVRMQQGLPPATQAVWRHAATTFPGIVSIAAWGDRAHQARRSCHNTGQAVDIQVARGTNPTPADIALGDRIASYYRDNAAKHDVRVVIWNRRIASARRGWTWRPYGGSSPHTRHVHLSIGCDG